MKSRDFLTVSSGMFASASSEAIRWREARKFAELPFPRVAYVEKGEGAAALFVHGFSLNGYQWRGALDRLHPHRRCIAPDLMSMGWTETPTGQEISPGTQAAMLGQLLDKLQIDAIDLADFWTRGFELRRDGCKDRPRDWQTDSVPINL
jgi:hypothetical protein